jgi:cytochrome b pre-mRNA-processing protein 3
MILGAFRRGHHERNMQALYGAIVAQARSAAFYSAYGVPDTVEGRFELIVLHLVLVLDRLRHAADAGSRGGKASRIAGQLLFDVFCRDLDHNLREMGTGDLAVPREMRRFGEAFYGRQASYGAALAVSGDGELEKALARNIFGVPGSNDDAARLARYVRTLGALLEAQHADSLLAGGACFPNPETLAYA